MGKSFSVTYATIFMIWLKTYVSEQFRTHIFPYKRFLDEISLIWSGLSVELYRLKVKFEFVNIPAIKFVIMLE